MGFGAKSRNVREYSAGEETVNFLTHILGVALAMAGLTLLVEKAWGEGGSAFMAALAFGASLVLEYLFSALYHAAWGDRAKRILKALDHCGIYLLIAGSYMPYSLVSLPRDVGHPLAIGTWVVAAVGMAAEASWTFRPRLVSAVLYLVMGWCIVAFLPSLRSAIDPTGFWLLMASGACYTAGVPFYLLKKTRYIHSVFHLFVVAGSTPCFLSVYLYVLWPFACPARLPSCSEFEKRVQNAATIAVRWFRNEENSACSQEPSSSRIREGRPDGMGIHPRLIGGIHPGNGLPSCGFPRDAGQVGAFARPVFPDLRLRRSDHGSLRPLARKAAFFSCVLHCSVIGGSC